MVHLGGCGAGLRYVEPPSQSNFTGVEDLSPALEGFVQQLEVLILGVVVKFGGGHEHVVYFSECTICFSAID